MWTTLQLNKTNQHKIRLDENKILTYQLYCVPQSPYLSYTSLHAFFCKQNASVLEKILSEI